MIEPHGGELISRELASEEAAELAADQLPRVTVSSETAQDLRNIGTGVYSPLLGPVGSADLEAILTTGRLASGVPWTIPIVLDVSREQADPLSEGDQVLVYEHAPDGERLTARLTLEEKHDLDHRAFAQGVFGTDDDSHPGVRRCLARGEVLLAGLVDTVPLRRAQFAGHDLTPRQVRAIIEERGWRTAVAFQTRNVPHVGHEDLQKTVLGLCDGLLIQPVVGRKKPGDFRDEVILAAYQALIEGYFARSRVILSVLPTEMRYAGPREAIMHAIMRKNHGCTHIVIGRDHAGVGDFYPPEAAIEIFADYPDLGIQPITIRGDFFHCRKCRRISSERTCPHTGEQQIPFSGTLIRDLLRNGGQPPAEIMRPEVFAVLQRAPNPFVE